MRPPLAPSLPEWPTDECSDCSIVAALAADRRWSSRCTVGRPRATDTDQEPGLISPMTHNAKEALIIELYKHLRPGDPPTTNNARNVLESLLSNSRPYFLEQPRHAPYGNCTFLRLRGPRCRTVRISAGMPLPSSGALRSPGMPLIASIAGRVRGSGVPRCSPA